jgi:hypothetical protein
MSCFKKPHAGKYTIWLGAPTQACVEAGYHARHINDMENRMTLCRNKTDVAGSWGKDCCEARSLMKVIQLQRRASFVPSGTPSCSVLSTAQFISSIDSAIAPSSLLGSIPSKRGILDALYTAVDGENCSSPTCTHQPRSIVYAVTHPEHSNFLTIHVCRIPRLRRQVRSSVD